MPQLGGIIYSHVTYPSQRASHTAIAKHVPESNADQVVDGQTEEPHVIVKANTIPCEGAVMVKALHTPSASSTVF